MWTEGNRALHHPSGRVGVVTRGGRAAPSIPWQRRHRVILGLGGPRGFDYLCGKLKMKGRSRRLCITSPVCSQRKLGGGFFAFFMTISPAKAGLR